MKEAGKTVSEGRIPTTGTRHHRTRLPHLPIRHLVLQTTPPRSRGATKNATLIGTGGKEDKIRAIQMKGRNKLLLWTAALTSVWACNADRVFEAHQGMEALLWAAEAAGTLETGPLELTNSVSLLNVRYNESYAFHKIYIRYLLKDSLDNLLTDSLINVSLF